MSDSESKGGGEDRNGSGTNDERPVINGKKVSKRFDRGGNEIDVDWETVFAPGLIEIGRPAHRRLLEEVGKADEPRVVFVGDAAEVGNDD